MKLSIIVLAYREWWKLKRCLQLLLHCTFTSQFEIIVVDNGADEKCKAVLHEFRNDIILIDNSANNSIPLANNLGAKQAVGQYLAFVNSDYYVSAFWDNHLIECLQKNKDAGLCGAMTNVCGNPQEQCVGEEFLPKKYIETDQIHCLMFTSKKVFDEVGGFDEGYGPYTWDDTDFAMAIKSKGYKIIIDGYTFVYHDYNWQKPNDAANAKKIVERNEKYFVKKWKLEKS